MTKNPKWEYSELVLALELYMLNRPSPPGKNSRDVKILYGCFFFILLRITLDLPTSKLFLSKL